MPTTVQFGRITEIPFREWIGEHRYMSCVYRQYDFPVNVYRENGAGERELIRVER